MAARVAASVAYPGYLQWWRRQSTSGSISTGIAGTELVDTDHTVESIVDPEAVDVVVALERLHATIDAIRRWRLAKSEVR
jgi:hypothetical protein